MKINPVMQRINFGRQETNDGQIRHYIRKQIMDRLGPTIYYKDFLTISKRDAGDMSRSASTMHRCGGPSDAQKGFHVDELMLGASGIGGLRIRESNRLYSGEYLTTPEKIPLINTLKDAGIKTVVALCGTEEYGKNCKKAGLNYISLHDIGYGTLHPFIIKQGMLKDITNNPERYPDKYADKITHDLKEYIKIMNGENENFPSPIYYGCTQGSNMTHFWTEIYKTLKDQDPNKKLDKGRIKEFLRLEEEIQDTYGRI